MRIAYARTFAIKHHHARINAKPKSRRVRDIWEGWRMEVGRYHPPSNIFILVCWVVSKQFSIYKVSIYSLASISVDWRKQCVCVNIFLMQTIGKASIWIFGMLFQSPEANRKMYIYAYCLAKGRSPTVYSITLNFIYVKAIHEIGAYGHLNVSLLFHIFI